MINFPTTVTVTRDSAGDYDSDGVYQPGGTSPVDIEMHIQPLESERSGNQELANRMGLESVDGLIRIYSNSELYPSNNTAKTKADRITYSGKTYEVTEVSKYGTLLPHWRCIAQVVDPQTEEAIV